MMDIQRELKNDLTGIKGAIEMQEGIYIPLKEVERMLINRIEQVRKLNQMKEMVNLKQQFHEETNLSFDYFLDLLKIALKH